MSTPPLPPPPPPPSFAAAQTKTSKPPTVPENGPPGALLVELLIYNGYPFMDHWAYLISLHQSSPTGVRIHATGAVNTGFKLEIQRMHNVDTYEDKPYKRVPLQWFDESHLNQHLMFNHFEPEMVVDDRPVCPFEASLFKVAAPGKSLNAVDSNSDRSASKRVTQRNCQTWIVESADQLVLDGLLNKEVAAYLHAVRQ